MKKIILALFIVALCCSCVTETGMCFDMRVSEPTPRVAYMEKEPSEEPPVLLGSALPPVTPVPLPIDFETRDEAPVSNSALVTIVSPNYEGFSTDVVPLLGTIPSPTVDGGSGEDYILVTGSHEAPSLPPTTLEEETYDGRTRYLNRAVSSSSPSVYETSIWDVSVKPVSPLGSSNGVELDISMTDRDNTLSADFNKPTELSLDISDWNAPESFRPMWLDDDGRSSALEVGPNYYVELGDDWDGEWEPGTWRDEEQFKPNNPGTYEVYWR